MSLDQLLKFSVHQNIAEDLDDKQLTALGIRAKRQFEEDLQSMEEWTESIEKGLKLMKPEWAPRDRPWRGASNYKDPIITEASVGFGDRAFLELLRRDDMVQYKVWGSDEEGTKKDSGERVATWMNYEISEKMPEWREDQRKFFYILPSYGAGFKKTRFDKLLGRNISEPIHYPNFVINQATKTMESARSFSHILDFSQNQVFERQKSGTWLKVEIYPKESDGDKGSNEANEVKEAEENEDRFIEQYTWADLDDDGYEEPYIVTFHQEQCKIVRVVARYNSESIIVREKADEEDKLSNIGDLTEGHKELFTNAGFTEDQEAERKKLLSGFEMVRIEPKQEITYYEYIPSGDGTFLGRGFFHLIGPLVMAMNTTQNQLTDAGSWANTPAGWMAKNARKKMGKISLRPGQFKSTELTPQDLANGIRLLPSKEPSAVLFQLLDKLESRTRAFTSVIDASQVIQANTAPTTALAILQEQLIPMSALMGSVIMSETKEFRKLFELNRGFIDPNEYAEVVEDDDADFEKDFNSRVVNVVPTASAEHASKFQRVQLAEVQVARLDLVTQSGGDTQPLVKNFYEAIGTPDALMQETWPTADSISPEAKARMEQQQAALDQANELKALQLDILKREQDRLDLKTAADIQKILGELRKTHAEMILTLEKAETEDQTNRIQTYTARVQNIMDQMDAVGASLSVQPNSQAVPGAAPGQAGQQGSIPAVVDRPNNPTVL